MKIKHILFLFLFVTTATIAQQFQLSPQAEISVLTIGQGESLNDAFGHNGFRIEDPANNLDVVYGYGKYDFDAPNFYLKFAQGKLNYLISKDSYADFYQLYSYFDRSIKSQVLNLTQDEKQKLYYYLVNNNKPENRPYLYDFFYDNCATKIRDVAEIATTESINFPNLKQAETKSFRELIHEQVGRNTWGSFGIDIALGSIIDRKASAKEQMFLPNYIHSTFAKAKVNTTDNLVKRSEILYQSKNKKYSSLFLTSPIVISTLLAFLILYITYNDNRNNRQSIWLDTLIFSVTGIVGVVLLFLWFGTDHTATGYNYNLLWALPLNLLAIPQLYKKIPKNGFKAYLKFSIIMLCLMTMHWIIGVQAFALALIPLVAVIAVRYIYLVRYLTNK
jgi:hypothetical protein